MVPKEERGEQMKLSKKDFLTIIEGNKACAQAIKWVRESKTGTFTELWNECERADWMLWILAKMAGQKGWPSKKTVVLCACDCAETALKFVPENENLPKIAIETARKWAAGEESKEECEKTKNDTYNFCCNVRMDFLNELADFIDQCMALESGCIAEACDSAYFAINSVFTSDSVSSAVWNAVDAYVYSVIIHEGSVIYDHTKCEYYSYNSRYLKAEALKNMADIIRKRVPF
jgi:hypothetical protein